MPSGRVTQIISKDKYYDLFYVIFYVIVVFFVQFAGNRKTKDEWEIILWVLFYFKWIWIKMERNYLSKKKKKDLQKGICRGHWALLYEEMWHSIEQGIIIIMGKCLFLFDHNNIYWVI